VGYVRSAEDRDFGIGGKTARTVESAEDSQNATKDTGTLVAQSKASGNGRSSSDIGRTA
jgi:hypothetical protein